MSWASMGDMDDQFAWTEKWASNSSPPSWNKDWAVKSFTVSAMQVQSCGVDKSEIFATFLLNVNCFSFLGLHGKDFQVHTLKVNHPVLPQRWKIKLSNRFSDSCHCTYLNRDSNQRSQQFSLSRLTLLGWSLVPRSWRSENQSLRRSVPFSPFSSLSETS